MLKLTPGQVTAATLVGVEFRPASPDEVHRLAMKRKIFQIDGTPVTATRDGAFLETAATLGQLIEEGEHQQRDLAKWEAATDVAPINVPPNVEAGPVSSPEPVLPAATVTCPLKSSSMPRDEEIETSCDVPAPSVEVVKAVPPAPTVDPLLAVLPSKAAGAKHTARVSRRERWVTAGAERRGRTAQHWSARRK